MSITTNPLAVVASVLQSGAVRSRVRLLHVVPSSPEVSTAAAGGIGVEEVLHATQRDGFLARYGAVDRQGAGLAPVEGVDVYLVHSQFHGVYLLVFPSVEVAFIFRSVRSSFTVVSELLAKVTHWPMLS